MTTSRQDRLFCPAEVLAGQKLVSEQPPEAFSAVLPDVATLADGQFSLIDPAAVTAADIAASNTRRLLADVRGDRSNY